MKNLLKNLKRKKQENPEKQFIEKMIKNKGFDVKPYFDGLHVPIGGERVVDFLPKIFKNLGLIKQLYDLQIVEGWGENEKDRVGYRGSKFSKPEDFIKEFYKTRNIYPSYIIVEGKYPSSGKDLVISFGDKNILN